jgi:hypothetical protein
MPPAPPVPPLRGREVSSQKPIHHRTVLTGDRDRCAPAGARRTTQRLANTVERRGSGDLRDRRRPPARDLSSMWRGYASRRDRVAAHVPRSGHARGAAAALVFATSEPLASTGRVSSALKRSRVSYSLSARKAWAPAEAIGCTPQREGGLRAPGRTRQYHGSHRSGSSLDASSSERSAGGRDLR